MSDELKPCPFCGSEALVNSIFGIKSPSRLYSVVCKGCLATTTQHDHESAARLDWNRRTDDWISVAEGLPEPSQVVLVASARRQELSLGCLRENGWNAVRMKQGGRMQLRHCPSGEITHWRLLPELPEEPEEKCSCILAKGLQPITHWAYCPWCGRDLDGRDLDEVSLEEK